MSLEVETDLYAYIPVSVCILTPRQIEYLALVALGLNNVQIANTLYVSHSTVKKTLEMIFDKLKANSRAQAITIGFLHNILNYRVLYLVTKQYDIPKISSRSLR